MKRFSLALLILLVASASYAAPPRPYHLELEADPAAPFPFLSKFGKVTLHVYGGGVRADTFWLNGFTRVGTPTITVENPLGRMYTEVPVSNLASIVGKLAGKASDSLKNAAGQLHPPVTGRVKGIAATRYRLSYGPEAYIDVWTTNVIPENPQLKSIVDQFVNGISPATAAVARKIPGAPIYVELNFRSYKKLPLLRMKSIEFDNKGEADALKTGMLYFKAPLLDALWK